MDVIDEVEMSSEDENWEEKQRGNIAKKTDRKTDRDAMGRKLTSLEILNHVKINVGVEGLKGILTGLRHDESSFSRVELRKVEELMKQAFVEFYSQLRLLKSYW